MWVLGVKLSLQGLLVELKTTLFLEGPRITSPYLADWFLVLQLAEGREGIQG